MSSFHVQENYEIMLMGFPDGLKTFGAAGTTSCELDGIRGFNLI